MNTENKKKKIENRGVCPVCHYKQSKITTPAQYTWIGNPRLLLALYVQKYTIFLWAVYRLAIDDGSDGTFGQVKFAC